MTIRNQADLATRALEIAEELGLKNEPQEVRSGVLTALTELCAAGALDIQHVRLAARVTRLLGEICERLADEWERTHN